MPHAVLAKFGKRSAAQWLPRSLQAKLEGALECELGDLRVHVGSEASSLGARSLVWGNDLYFTRESYQPSTPLGQRLLVRGLAHIVQQQQGRVDSSPFERTAIVQDPQLDAEAEVRAQTIAQKLWPRSVPRRAFWAVQRMVQKSRTWKCGTCQDVVDYFQEVDASGWDCGKCGATNLQITTEQPQFEKEEKRLEPEAPFDDSFLARPNYKTTKSEEYFYHIAGGGTLKRFESGSFSLKPNKGLKGSYTDTDYKWISLDAPKVQRNKGSLGKDRSHEYLIVVKGGTRQAIQAVSIDIRDEKFEAKEDVPMLYRTKSNEADDVGIHGTELSGFFSRIVRVVAKWKPNAKSTSYNYETVTVNPDQSVTVHSGASESDKKRFP